MPSSKTHAARLALYVAIAAWAVYLLTASNTLQIGADESVVFATAESLARHGRFDIDQLASVGKDDVWAYGMWGQDGRQYGKYGPVHALLAAPLLWLALKMPVIRPVDTVLLFNSVVTAATLAVLFWAVRVLGFRRRTGLLVAGLYGFGTFAWIYAKSFFGEPLSALLLVAGVAWAVRFRTTERRTDAVLSGVCVGLAIGVKWSNAVIAPLVFAFVFLTTRRRRAATTWLVPPVISVALLLLFNTVRFGSPWITGYGPEPGFTTPILHGLWGLLLSPGKSWFLYSPVLLLGLTGVWLMWQRDRAVTALLLGAVTVHLVVYATWWAWWGGWGWGPRLLLPATPLMVLLAAPTFERISLGPRKRWKAIAASALAMVSVVVQLLGIAVHYATYLGEQSRHDPLVNGPTVADVWQSPLIAQARYLQSPCWDFAWINAGTIDGLHLAAKVLFVGVAGAGLWFAWRGRSLWVPLLACGVAVAGFGLIRSSATADEAYRALATDLASAPPDVIVLSDYARQATFWNVNETSVPVIGAPESAEPPPRLMDKLDAAITELEATGGEVVQLAQNPPGDASSGVERRLARRLYAANHAWYGNTRLLRFAVPPAAADTQTGAAGARYGDWAMLERYEVRRGTNGLYVSLFWHALAPIATRYTVSVQLLDQSGVVAQHDGEPAGTTQPTTTWEPGETIIDRHALFTGERPSGELWVILYDPASGERVDVTAADGSPAGDAYRLLRLP